MTGSPRWGRAEGLWTGPLIILTFYLDLTVGLLYIQRVKGMEPDEETEMTQTRTDPHRPSVIIPGDYEYRASFIYPTTYEPGYMDELRGLGESMSPRWSKFWRKDGETGGCDVCGSNFLQGAAFLHVPSGEFIKVGWICADEMELQYDQTHAETIKRERDRQLRLSMKARKRDRKAAQFQTFLDANPDVANAAAQAQAVESPSRGWAIVADIAGKGRKYGSISKAQADLMVKIAKDEVERAAQPPEAHVDAPEGRLEVVGTVVSLKTMDSEWGTTWKMTVKVETPEGSWLAWGTCPAALFTDVEKALDAIPEKGLASALRGATVRFTATLAPGRDAHFAIFKRPSKASVDTLKAVA